MKPNGSSAMNRSREVACLSVYFFLFHPIGMIHIYYRFLSTEKMVFDGFLATLIIACCGSIRFFVIDIGAAKPPVPVDAYP